MYASKRENISMYTFDSLKIWCEFAIGFVSIWSYLVLSRGDELVKEALVWKRRNDYWLLLGFEWTLWWIGPYRKWAVISDHIIAGGVSLIYM